MGWSWFDYVEVLKEGGSTPFFFLPCFVIFIVINQKNIIMEAAEIKSLIRHTLTAIGTLLVFTGLNKHVPIVEYLTENLLTAGYDSPFVPMALRTNEVILIHV